MKHIIAYIDLTPSFPMEIIHIIITFSFNNNVIRNVGMIVILILIIKKITMNIILSIGNMGVCP